MTHDITNVNQKAKLSYINARADWKEDLEKHLATQMQLIKVWDVMKNEEQYSMTDLSPDDVEIDDTNNKNNDVQIVCISDTHGGHEYMDIPTGKKDVLNYNIY